LADIIVAGNTSGAITISAPLVAGSGVLTLPTGTDTLIGKATTDTLTNKSIAATQLTGTIAAAALPAGSVLQVVQGSYAVTTSTATTTLVDTGLTATITPRSTSNKILVIFCQSECNNSLANSGFVISLLRGATVIGTPAIVAGYGGSSQNITIAATFLDSPSTTSAVTYKTQFARSVVNTGTIAVNGDSSTSTITLMEIAG
jgi:hypothetical protein